MKKFLLTISILISFATFSFAQNDSLQTKQKFCSNKWQFSASLNSVEAQTGQFLFDSWGTYAYSNLYGYLGNRTDKSLSFSITPKYSLNDNIQLRFEAGMTNIYITSHYNGVNDSNASGNTTLIKDDTLKQKIFRFVPGVQWTFMKKKIIECYCGFSAEYIYYSKTFWKDNLKNNVTGEFGRWAGITHGGFGAGAGAFAGFNILLQKYISIGVECSSALIYYKTGGIQSGDYIFQAGMGPVTKREWSISDNVAKGFEFSKIMPSINITLHF